MFVDCLEVEKNLKMSKKLSDQDSGGEIKDTYKLVGPYRIYMTSQLLKQHLLI